MNRLYYILEQLLNWAQEQQATHAAEMDNVIREATEQRVKASFLEARDALRKSDIERARVTGQGQSFKALLDQLGTWEFMEVEMENGDREDYLSADELKLWLLTQLKDLGEEPREMRTHE